MEKSGGIIGLWRETISQPFETLEREKGKDGLSAAFKNISTGACIWLFLMMLGNIAVLIRLGGEIGHINVVISTYFLPAAIITFFLTLAIFLLNTIVFFFVAKLLGGNGNFSSQSYLLSLCLAPGLAVFAFFIFLGAVLAQPFDAIVGFFVPFVAIYAIFLCTLALKTEHEYDWGRAVLTWMVPYLVFILIAIILLLYAVESYFRILSMFQTGID